MRTQLATLDPTQPIKRLTLKKETLRHLQPEEMMEIEGGAWWLSAATSIIGSLASIAVSYALYCDSGLLG